MDERARPNIIEAGTIIDLTAEVPEGSRHGREPRLVGAGVAMTLLVIIAVAIRVGPLINSDRSTGISGAGIADGRRADAASADAGMPKALPVHAVFLDAQHGYVTMLRCPFGRFRSCLVDLSVTADGGVTWSRRPLPNRSPIVALSPSHLYVLTPDTLVFDQAESFAVDPGPADSSVPSGQPGGRPGAAAAGWPGYTPAGRWLSVDGGHTWRRVEPTPVATVDRVPAGGSLFFPMPGSYGSQPPVPHSTPTVGGAQVLREDGTAVRLAHGPDDGRHVEYSAGVVASDGSIWVTGTSFSDETVSRLGRIVWVLRVSRDRGRSWRSVTTPAGRPPAEFYTTDGRSLYGVSSTDGGTSTLTYSFDAAATWHDLRMPAATDRTLTRVAVGRLGPGAAAPSVAPVPDGALLIVASGRTYRLAPMTDRLSEIPDAPRLGAIMPAGRLVVGVSIDMTVFYVSSDGIRWRALGLS